MPLPVPAINALTARWAATIDGGSTTLSGLGVWPLLAMLRVGADEVTAAELDTAVGGADPRAATELLTTLREATAIQAALGLWSAPHFVLESAWLASVPDHAHGQLSGDERADRQALDAWARANTDGLIERMPVATLARVRLLLASAIAVRTSWEQRFTEAPWLPEAGPWREAPIAGLRRADLDLDQVAVADSAAGKLTFARCQGQDDVDVLLVLGPPDAPAGEVLAAAATAAGTGVPGSRLPDGTPGPGLQIGDRASIDRPTLTVRTPRFRVSGSHDLAQQSGLFGLATAMDPTVGHFPGISNDELFLSAARQDAVAIFTAQGFEAAAVTAMTLTPTSMRRPSGQLYRQITVTFDRPFGFLAVHRPTGLILVAGWVDEPDRPERA